MLTQTKAVAPILHYQQIFTIALALFFFGGASALIYEVAWVRLLSLVFGVSVFAVSAVLSAFMGGLAVGSWLFGRIAARWDNASPQPLLRLYAILQIGVGIFAFITPALFDQLTRVYVWFYHTFAPGDTAFGLLRFGLAMLVLLIPTILMGGTLPAISQLLARDEHARGTALGSLYAANTFGAVLGTCAAGLLLIRFLGTSTTIYLAAVIDLAIAGVALLLSTRSLDLTPPESQEPRPRATRNPKLQPETLKRRKNDHKKSPQPATENTPILPSPTQNSKLKTQNSKLHRQIALYGFALSGFASLGYQIVWTRLLAIFSLNAVYSFTIMLTTFLAGLAIGGAIMARQIDKRPDPLRVFGSLQLAIGVCGVLILFVFARMPSLLERFTLSDTFRSQVYAEFFAATITMLLPTLLIGATFPVAARVYTSGDQPDTDDAPVSDRVGRMYALNTLGAMLGSLVAGFALIPLLGLQRTALVLAALNLLIGTVALLATPPLARRRLAAALAVVLLGAILLPPGIYLGFREGAIPQLKFYREGVDATVAVFQVDNPPLKISFVNGRNEVPTDAQSMRAFYLLGHLPPLLRPEAESALMVSFGNGIATGALSRHNIPQIQAVELVAEQIEAASLYTQENRDVLNYPGLRIAHEDGRNFLLRDTRRYQIVTADATHPINSSSWALFTREFYTLVRQHMTDDGVFVQWLPFHDLSENDYRTIIHTFQSVFPHTTIFYTGGIHTFLVATPAPLTREQVAALDARIKAAGVQDDIGDGKKLAEDFLMNEEDVARYTAGARIATDDTAFFIPSRDMDFILESFRPYLEANIK